MDRKMWLGFIAHVLGECSIHFMRDWRSLETVLQEYEADNPRLLVRYVLERIEY
jgi:hypothetical protein